MKPSTFLPCLAAACSLLALPASAAPLKELHPGFLVGSTATNGNGTFGEGTGYGPNAATFRTTLLREFNLGQVTCYPAWDTWKGLKSYDFTYVNLGVNYLNAQGYPIAMHLLGGPNGYYPDWFKTGTYTAEQLDSMLEDFIRVAMTTNDNAAKVKYWNVVNECIDSNNHYYANNTNCQWQNMGWEDDKSGLSGSAKVHTQHPVWIRKAFEYAKKYAKPGVRLELRDYNIEFWQVYKSASFYQLVRHLLNSGAPIDAVGLQCHMDLGANYNWTLLTRTIQEYKKLGLEVYGTELDIGDKAKSWNADKAAQQKTYYQNFFNAASIGGMDWACTWGMKDNVSQYWRYDESPLLFDANYVAKPAYDGAALGLAPATPSYAPRILGHPVSTTVAASGTAVLSCEVYGQGPITYQWNKDGKALPGATAATLSLPGLSTANAGDYTVSVTNAAGTTTSRLARLQVAEPVVGRIVNMSVRAQAGLGGNPLTVGFVPEGSGAKNLLVRGGGPALLDFGVSNALKDPKLDVFTGQTRIAGNDDWFTDAKASLLAVFDKVGAFGYGPTSLDAAIVLDIDGPRTVQINGKAGASGVVLVEAYQTSSTDSSRLTNVSARNYCGTGNDVLIAGFVIDGTAPKRVLIRGVGPGLAKFGVTGVLADPKLEIYTKSNGSDVVFASNDNWCDQPGGLALRDISGPFTLDPGSADAALLLTLPPGSYSAMVSGIANATGEALVEVYELP